MASFYRANMRFIGAVVQLYSLLLIGYHCNLWLLYKCRATFYF